MLPEDHISDGNKHIKAEYWHHPAIFFILILSGNVCQRNGEERHRTKKILEGLHHLLNNYVCHRKNNLKHLLDALQKAASFLYDAFETKIIFFVFRVFA